MTGFRDLPIEVQQRMRELNIRDVADFAMKPIPALDGRSIAEVTAQEGVEAVMKYLDRLEELVGLRAENEHLNRPHP